MELIDKFFSSKAPVFVLVILVGLFSFVMYKFNDLNTKMRTSWEEHDIEFNRDTLNYCTALLENKQ